MGRRVAFGVGKAGVSIANGILLSRSAVLNPVLTVAMVAYNAGQAIYDYHSGATNSLGLRTSRTDVALRIGKEVAMAGIGTAIGTAVGALVGLSAIPVAGQIIVSAILSVGVGIAVGTLLTRYLDRLVTRWQIRSHYGYPRDELGARLHFEGLLEERHDLSTLETCKIVQHYSDYRVASGWESANDIDDYRATGHIRHMPVSFQHFAIAQLQRKWGFLGDHGACTKVFKALMLQHHPDRGGSTEMAALLNRDHEVYAFCQGWDEDCQSLLQPEDDETDGVAAARARPKKRNVVVDFLRSLFRHSTTSDIEASDLHEFGLLMLETGTAANLHGIDELENRDDDDHDKGDTIGDASSFSPAAGGGGATSSGAGPSGTAKQRSIARVLAALKQTYQTASEAITFSGLAQASQDQGRWDALRTEVVLFNRMQCFIRVANEADPITFELDSDSEVIHLDDEDEEEEEEGKGDGKAGLGDGPAAGAQEHVCHGFRWCTIPEAMARREKARVAIVGAIFSQETTQQLEAALGLWQAAQSMAGNYFKQCAAEQQQQQQRGATTTTTASPTTRGHPVVVGDGDGTVQTLDTLLSIQRRMEKLAREVRDPWHGQEGEWAARSLQGYSRRLDNMREVGLTASFALAGEYAKTVVVPRTEECESYFRAWSRKRRTLETMLHEMRLAKSEREALESHINGGSGGGGRSPTAAEGRAEALAELQQRSSDYTMQLVLLQQEQAEVDAKVAELVDICTSHLPEAGAILDTLPSTVGRCVDRAGGGGLEVVAYHRRLLYERERTLMCYQRVELDAASRVVESPDPREVFPFDCVHFTLLKAVHTDVLTGTVFFCWLKSYMFPDRADPAPPVSLDDIDDDDDDDDDATRRRFAQSQFIGQILDSELAISEGCSSKHILSPTEVFCDPEKRRVFFQIPRGATQQRFSSVYDVRKRIRPLGLRWLLDSLQCLIDLHSCQCAHGSVLLDNFTYDDFGGTALGFFTCARRLDLLRHTVEELAAAEVAKDVTDFGAMLLAEVLPYLAATAAATQSPAGGGGATTPPPPPPEDPEQHCERVFREVGERLIGKEEPRWSLLQARTFVRRCMQFKCGTDERAFLFTKQITHPPYWGPSSRAQVPQLIFRDRRVKLNAVSVRGRVKVFLNQNLPLWETYWMCRAKMALERMGTYSLPPTLQSPSALLPCSDDCEVNERFLWFPCEREEDAWGLCQSGFPQVRRKLGGDKAYEDTAVLHLGLVATDVAPRSASQWGVICRVAVGTVVAASANASLTAPVPPDDSEDKMAYAAKRRCHMQAPPDNSYGGHATDKAAVTVLVPCPWARCFPEYVVRIGQNPTPSPA